ncbi:uncharacterized protein LOC125224136 isoform X2 [Salvia hispanica]|nr:uncharacterized protein LOC125224136 isoform X2 [Salvia hispanica]
MGQNALFSSKGKGSKGVNNKKSGSRGRNPRRTEKRESRVTPRSFAEKVLRKEKKAKGATTNEKISEEERMLLQYRRFFCNHVICGFWKEHNALSSFTKMKSHWIAVHSYLGKKHCPFCGNAIIDELPCASFGLHCPLYSHNSLDMFYNYLRDVRKKELEDQGHGEEQGHWEERAWARATGRSWARARATGRSRARARATGRSRARATGRSRARATGRSRARARATGRSRARARATGRSRARATGRSRARATGRSRARATGRSSARARKFVKNKGRLTC